MNRKEEIRQEAHKRYPYEGGTKGLICENSIPIFIQGAEWADKTTIEKAKAWVKICFTGLFGENLADTITNEFAKYLEE